MPASPNATGRRRIFSNASNRAIEAERRQRQRGRQLLIVGLVTVLVAALAVFGTIQWRAALDAKGNVEDLLMVNDLVAASSAELDDEPGARSVARDAIRA